jgi:hypothetical protein
MKKLKQTTLIVIIIGIALVVALFYGGFNVPGPSLNAFSGRLAVTVNEVKRIDGSAYEFEDTQCRWVHGRNFDYNDQVASISSDVCTGSMTPEDKGIWYYVIDYGTNTTCWLDQTATKTQDYVSDIIGWDGDRDGMQEVAIKYDFSSLEKTAEYETRNTDVTQVLSVVDLVNDFTSLTNVTSIDATSYKYVTCTGYMTGIDEGDLINLAKVEIQLSTSGTNETYPDSSYIILTHYKLGAYTFSASQFGSYDLSNARYQLKFGDQVNAFGSKDYYCEKNSGDLWCTYELKVYAKWPSLKNRIWVTLEHWFYSPDGTISSASIDQVVELRDAYA